MSWVVVVERQSPKLGGGRHTLYWDGERTWSTVRDNAVMFATKAEAETAFEGLANTLMHDARALPILDEQLDLFDEPEVAGDAAPEGNGTYVEVARAALEAYRAMLDEAGLDEDEARERTVAEFRERAMPASACEEAVRCAIGLFGEYRDRHGYGKDEAALAAITEVAEAEMSEVRDALLAGGELYPRSTEGSAGGCTGR